MSIELTPEAKLESERLAKKAMAVVAATPIGTFPIKQPRSMKRKIRILVEQYRYISMLKRAVALMEGLHGETLNSIPLDDLGLDRLIDTGVYCIGRNPKSGKVTMFPKMQERSER